MNKIDDSYHPQQDLDDIDRWAEAFGRWDEFSRTNSLSSDRQTNYIPKCHKCKGIGETYDKHTYRKDTCRRCGGKGWSNPKPKFFDYEILQIVRKLGEDRVRELVYLYNLRRGNI